MTDESGRSAPQKVPVTRISWAPCVRIVPSRFPPVDVFERVASADDLAAVHAIEGLTNDRLRAERGELVGVQPGDAATGPGSSYIMAPFLHPAPAGGRFDDGSFGAYYAARDRDTAVAETVYHRERFMRATAQPPLELDMRVLEARLDGWLHDLRGMGRTLREVYDASDYTMAQALARMLRGAGSSGIAYDSVRQEGGECAAVFRPRLLSGCRQAEHLVYAWNGERIAHVFEKRLRRRSTAVRTERR